MNTGEQPTSAALVARAEQHPGPQRGADVSDDTIQHAHIIVLSLNDVYELLPNHEDHGGVAEFATLLKRTQTETAQEFPDAKIIVTLNGDFLWRSELDRRDKGPLMMEMLRCWGIEYVVLGNHEFDHGAEYLDELLSGATFMTFGSNVRLRSDGSIMPRVVDTHVIELQGSTIKLGLFGVCTTETGEDPFAGQTVVFEDEMTHARRCVDDLQAQGTDLVIALTHAKMTQDKQIARKVPGISLMLGGHDHDVMTEFVGNTMIHKTGQNALWLGQIHLRVTKQTRSSSSGPSKPAIEVTYEWQMLHNSGYPPDTATQALVQAYLDRVRADDEASGKLVPLARCLTELDGTRYTSRRRECGVGYLVTDAIRAELGTDVAVIHAGLIKGDKLNPPGFDITAAWLERTLPQPKPVIVLSLSVQRLKRALEYMLRRYPAMSSSMPHTSGLLLEFEEPLPTTATGTITSLRLVPEPEEELIESDRLLRVAVPRVSSMDGWREHFAPALDEQAPPDGPIVCTVVERYLAQLGDNTEVAYARNEHRMRAMRRMR